MTSSERSSRSASSASMLKPMRACRAASASDRSRSLITGSIVSLLRHFVARMQRGKLDRNAGIVADVGTVGAAVERGDGIGIGAQVAQGVGLGARGLAQHVVGIEITLLQSSRRRAAPLPRWCGRARTARPSRAWPRTPRGGSPARQAGAPSSAACRRCRHRLSSSTRPVSMSAQVEALTKIELDSPECADQSCGAILSWIRSSMVCVSGTRSSASARHISATPSLVDRP